MKRIPNFTKYNKELIQLLARIKSEHLMQALLSDLLTPNEYDEIITRLQIVKQLVTGIPQRTVAKNLNVSIAKITRGSRMLLNKHGGFNKILQRQKK